MNYTIYEPNGKIVSNVITNEIDLQVSGNQKYIEGSYDSRKFYIEDDEPKPIAEYDEEKYFFDYDAKQIKEIVKSFDVLKLEAISERRKRLVLCDWTQLPDVPEETRLKWQEYRQALRDITLQEGFPENIIWPTKPE